jgi:hypothetical protein
MWRVRSGRGFTPVVRKTSNERWILRQSPFLFKCKGMKHFEVKNLLQANGHNNLSYQVNLYAAEKALFSVTCTFNNSHAMQWTGCIPYTASDTKSIPAWTQVRWHIRSHCLQPWYV